MASDFEKWVLEETLTAEVADCLLHEARKMITNALRAESTYGNVYRAFVNLGRLTPILVDGFEAVRRELYEMAKEKLLGFYFVELLDFSEEDLKHAEKYGLSFGQRYALPAKVGMNSIHYGFVAETVGIEIYGKIRYTQKWGWEVLEYGSWHRCPKERGIVGLIYDVMREKIGVWREALADPMGVGGWLEKLEKNINDPDWLSKVEELLLKVDHFGVEIVSDEA
jgi:hypothetical protein